MKNYQPSKAFRKIAAFVFAFVLIVSNVVDLVAQPTVNTPESGCFHTVVGAAASPCSGPCYNDGSDCSNCWTIKLYDVNCPYPLSPDVWKIWSEDPNSHAFECFSVCGTNANDWNIEGDYYNGNDHNHVRCDQQPKWPEWQYPSSSPITSINPGSLTICAPPGSVVHIELVHHSIAGTPCQQPCNETTIQF